MADLPVPGASADVWADLLNTWLLVAHNADGSLKASDTPGYRQLNLHYNGVGPMPVDCMVGEGYDPASGGLIWAMLPSALVFGSSGPNFPASCAVDASGVIQGFATLCIGEGPFFGGFDQAGNPLSIYLPSVYLGGQSGSGGYVATVQPGSSIQVDSTDPLNPVVSASRAIGVNAVASGADSVSLGDSGVAYSSDQTVIAATNAAGLGLGSSQHSVVVAQAQTVNTGPAYLATCLGPTILELCDLNGAAVFNRTMRVRLTVVARRTDVPGTDSVWECDAVLRGDGTSAYSWIGGDPPIFTVVAQDTGASAWLEPVLSIANLSPAWLQCLVTGADGHTVNWEATLTLDEVAG